MILIKQAVKVPDRQGKAGRMQPVPCTLTLPRPCSSDLPNAQGTCLLPYSVWVTYFTLVLSIANAPFLST